MQKSDSLEELSIDDTAVLAHELDDVDLDKELGLTPETEQVNAEEEKPKEMEQPVEVQQEEKKSGGGGWWGVFSGGAANLMNATKTNELSKALISATEKASAAATSFNENYKISESVSNVAKSMATIVEQKGTDFKNITVHTVEKFLDTIDPIDLDNPYAFDSDDFETSSAGKVKVIITSTDPNEVEPVVSVFETVYGEENVYARGIPTEIMSAKQCIGFKNALKVAELKMEKLSEMKLIKETEDIIVIAFANFIAQLEDQWCDYYAIILHDKKNNIRLQCFSQGVPFDSEIAQKALSLTLADYPHKQTGASVTISNLIAISNNFPADYDWYLHETDGRVNRSLVLQVALGTICGKHYKLLKDRKNVEINA